MSLAMFILFFLFCHRVLEQSSWRTFGSDVFALCQLENVLLAVNNLDGTVLEELQKNDAVRGKRSKIRKQGMISLAHIKVHI